MSELNRIFTCYQFSGADCTYINRLEEGFVLGIAVLCIVFAFIEIVCNINDMYIKDYKKEDEKEEVSEGTQEKSEEDEKDD